MSMNLSMSQLGTGHELACLVKILLFDLFLGWW